MNIVLALLVFTVIVLVHELGHFWAARRAGIQVIEFSIGMGPRLFHFKRGDTIYSLKAFPLGGSCRMLGDEENPEENTEAETPQEADVGTRIARPQETDAETRIARPQTENPRSFNAKPVSKRMMVILGGAVMNFILALVLATAISMFNPYREATIRDFPEGSPLREAGLMLGDRIVRLDGRRINMHGDLSLAMMNVDGSPITLEVMRESESGSERLSFTITPFYNDGWRLGFFWGFGFGPFANMPAEFENQPGMRRVGYFESFAMGFYDVSFYIRATMVGVGRLFTHGFNVDEVMGPIGLVDTVGGSVSEAFTTGGATVAFWTMLNFTVLLSANLGVLNLLPIPALDGGRMVFLILEAIRRKPIPPEREGLVHFIGFILLMALAVVVAYNDILRFF